jgi:hypothetical protein
LTGGEAHSLINPEYQPVLHLWKRYLATIGGRIVARDEDKGTMTLKVTDVFNGKFEPKTVTITAADDIRDEVIFIRDGLHIVAFVGKHLEGHENEILFYTGGGVWQHAEFGPNTPGQWRWTKVDQSQAVDSLFGCFNGDTKQFYDLMLDAKSGTDFFPPRPFIQFGDGIEIAKFDQSPRGVALYDIDGDGDLDAYACSPGGNGAFLQTAALKFEDRTEALGLSGVTSASCSFADINADGKADLLAGGRILLGGKDGFSATELLPDGADKDVKSSAFVELNGDGYPDAIISKVGAGLHAYLNPGEGGGAFKDSTEAMGLSKEACGAGQTGFFAPGDFDGDGRTDLFYAAQGVGGLLLIQTKEGVFEPGRLGLDLSTFGDGQALTGAGCIAPLWRADHMTLVVPMDASFALFAVHDGQLAELVTATNELLNQPTEAQLATLCADLNLDGRVDIYTISRSDANTYHTNRGYGSYMNSAKRDPQAFPTAHRLGAWSAAAGDVNDDGAPDVLLGGRDGRLVLMVNETLANRKPKKRALYHEQKLLETRIATIRVAGPVGVVNAELKLADQNGQVAALRQIGTNVNVGSCSSPVVDLAVRGNGRHALTVIWSDGATRKVPLSFGEEQRIRLSVERPKATHEAK